jgi:hypothetical protein
MDWKPMDSQSVRRLVADGLLAGDDALRAIYRQVAREPARWELHPWGDLGSGFWVVAVHEDRVLWFNDIEDGFKVSTFAEEGRIPGDQYWCNQDEFHLALRILRDGGDHRLGPPRPLTS